MIKYNETTQYFELKQEDKYAEKLATVDVFKGIGNEYEFDCIPVPS